MTQHGNGLKNVKAHLTKLKASWSMHRFLSYPGTNKEFTLTTYANGQALGYILNQKDNEENERVIAYGGRTFSKSERNYPITGHEGLAIVEGIKAYYPYNSKQSCHDNYCD